MSEFKGTRGEIEKIHVSNDRGDYFKVMCGNTSICNITTRNDEQVKHNANLIVDAFKVRQQINCELSDLLEQRNKMLEMLERIMVNYDKGTQTYLECQKLIKQSTEL